MYLRKLQQLTSAPRRCSRGGACGGACGGASGWTSPDPAAGGRDKCSALQSVSSLCDVLFGTSVSAAAVESFPAVDALSRLVPPAPLEQCIRLDIVDELSCQTRARFTPSTAIRLAVD